ncbi:MAG: polynucleotide adenylyltransferase PcnB, partial [Gammaproteobacteria bacterium]|nr:polynucleotide adenylyltransferase PcnB [Gammaproteobacteria bacterium]
ADAIAQAGLRTLTEQQLSTSIPKRFAIPMREIWSLQFRLPIRRGKRAEKVRSHKRFRAAYDFLILREESGEKLDNLGKWWTHYQEAKEEQKEALRTTAYKRVTKRPRAKKTPNN